MKQKEYFGRGKIDYLPLILKKLNARRLLLVTGKNSYTSSGAKTILENLLTPFEKFHFKDFSTNPKFEDVQKGCSLIKNKDFDAVIAVGGGSVLDMGKMINIFSSQQFSPSDIIMNKKPIVIKGKPLIAIPTTS